MKKSTLITTIAMIVVVVVALSTATYAWFSSTSTATASSSFTTTATGDWSMIEGTVTLSNVASDATVGAATVSFASAAQDQISYTNTLNSNIWAPYSTIATAYDGSAAAPAMTGLVGFVNCLKDGTDNKVERKLDRATGGEGQNLGKTALDDSQTGAFVKPLALRILNVSGSDKTLQMNVTINAGPAASATNNSKYAGAAVRFYIYEITSANVASTYTSGYNVAGDCTEATIGTTSANSNSAAVAAAAANNTGVTLLEYTAGNIASGYTTAQTDDLALGITAGDAVKTYTFNMGNYPANGFSNILIYAWVDGYVADASAGAADFSVCFGFKSVQAQSSNGD